MRINLTSVLVDDQEKALRFYTDVLGFVKKADIPLGEHRWLTVVAGLGQVVGLGVFFYNLLPRIRSARKAE